MGRKCRHDLRLKDSGVNEKQTVFLIINRVNIISYAYLYRCTTTSDQWPLGLSISND